LSDKEEIDQTVRPVARCDL